MRYTDAVRFLRNKSIDIVCHDSMYMYENNKSMMVWVGRYDVDEALIKSVVTYKDFVRQNGHVILRPVYNPCTCREVMCQPLIQGKSTAKCSFLPGVFYQDHFYPGSVGMVTFTCIDAAHKKNMKDGLYVINYLEDLAHSVHTRVYDSTLYRVLHEQKYIKNHYKLITSPIVSADTLTVLVPAMWMRTVATMSLYLLLLRSLIQKGAVAGESETISDNANRTLVTWSDRVRYHGNADANSLGHFNDVLKKYGIEEQFPLFYARHYRTLVRGIHEDNQSIPNNYGMTKMMGCVDGCLVLDKSAQKNHVYYNCKLGAPAQREFVLRMADLLKKSAPKVSTGTAV